MHVDFPQFVTLLAVALAEITIRTTGVRLHQTSPSPRLQDTRSQPLQTSHKDRTFTGQHPVPLQDLPPPRATHTDLVPKSKHGHTKQSTCWGWQACLCTDHGISAGRSHVAPWSPWLSSWGPSGWNHF